MGGQNPTVQKVAVCLIKAMQRWVKFVQLPNKNTTAVLLKPFRCFFMSTWKKFHMQSLFLLSTLERFWILPDTAVMFKFYNNEFLNLDMLSANSGCSHPHGEVPAQS